VMPHDYKRELDERAAAAETDKQAA
jgi:hypothetical protein